MGYGCCGTGFLVPLCRWGVSANASKPTSAKPHRRCVYSMTCTDAKTLWATAESRKRPKNYWILPSLLELFFGSRHFGFPGILYRSEM